MAHYAKVEDGIVTRVIVAEEDFFDTFVDDSPGEWIQTSYNTRGNKHYDPDTGLEDNGIPLRYNYAGIGFSYDADKNAFIPPKLFDSWTLNENTCLWEPPVAYPDDGQGYVWNEDTTSWDLLE